MSQQKKRPETEAEKSERYTLSTFRPNERPQLPSFERSLFEMDSRIRLFELFDELESDHGFLPCKDMICIPIALPSADHEIAHMVEMTNPKRWTLPDWGINIHEPRTQKGLFASLSRETRVRAIQRHITPAIPNYAPLSNYHFWEPMVKKNVPFGRFKTYEEVYSWVIDLHEKTYAAWSLERIRHEWEIRLNHIQNWMETKAAA
jgi:hypothetical protein